MYRIVPEMSELMSEMTKIKKQTMRVGQMTAFSKDRAFWSKGIGGISQNFFSSCMDGGEREIC